MGVYVPRLESSGEQGNLVMGSEDAEGEWSHVRSLGSAVQAALFPWGLPVSPKPLSSQSSMVRSWATCRSSMPATVALPRTCSSTSADTCSMPPTMATSGETHFQLCWSHPASLRQNRLEGLGEGPLVPEKLGGDRRVRLSSGIVTGTSSPLASVTGPAISFPSN